MDQLITTVLLVSGGFFAGYMYGAISMFFAGRWMTEPERDDG